MPSGWHFSGGGIWRIKPLMADNALNDAYRLKIYRVDEVNESGNYNFGDGNDGVGINGQVAGSASKVITSSHYMEYKFKGRGTVKNNLNISCIKNETWDYLINDTGWWASLGNYNVEYSGEYIFEASCQIHLEAGAMVVTYLVYNYSTGVPKREVKIIEISTGKITDLIREQMKVDEDLWTQPAAIGVQLV